MKRLFLILMVALFVVLATGCTTTAIVAPPESIMKCEKVDVPVIDTNAEHIAFTNRLVKANIVCYNSMNNVRVYVAESKKQYAKKPK